MKTINKQKFKILIEKISNNKYELLTAEEKDFIHDTFSESKFGLHLRFDADAETVKYREIDKNGEKLIRLQGKWEEDDANTLKMPIDTFLDENAIFFSKKKGKTINPEGKNKHFLIEGENLLALEHMVRMGQKVDIIYIDPPYNTGNEFIYNDKRISSDDVFKHSTWLNFMKKRLQLAKKLLSDTGVILVSIDDNEQAYLKVLMDEIFGEDKFIANFIWRKKPSPATDGVVGTIHEYILAYGKPQINLDPMMKTAQKYLMDENGKEYYLGSMRKAVGFKYSESLDFPIRNKETGKLYFMNGEKTLEEFEIEKTKYLKAVTAGEKPKLRNGWPWSREKVDKDYGELVFKNNSVYVKQYKREGVNPISILPDYVGRTRNGKQELREIFNGEAPFSFPKPSTLISHFLRILGNKEAVVLDFFAGSGTTGQSVMEVNSEDEGKRNCILIVENFESPTSVENVTLERLHRVTTGEGSNGETFKWIEKPENESFKNASWEHIIINHINKRMVDNDLELEKDFDNSFELISEIPNTDNIPSKREYIKRIID